MQPGDLHRVRVDARAARPTSRRQRLASGAADLGWEADAEDLADLNHVRFLARLQASQKVGDIPIAGIGGHHRTIRRFNAGRLASFDLAGVSTGKNLAAVAFDCAGEPGQIFERVKLRLARKT